jgi:hypothetical protein
MTFINRNAVRRQIFAAEQRAPSPSHEREGAAWRCSSPLGAEDVEHVREVGLLASGFPHSSPLLER